MFISFIHTPTAVERMRTLQAWIVYAIAWGFLLWLVLADCLPFLTVVTMALLFESMMIFIFFDLILWALLVFLAGVFTMGDPAKPFLLGALVGISLGMISNIAAAKVISKWKNGSMWSLFARLLLAAFCPLIPIIVDAYSLRRKPRRSHLRLVYSARSSR